MSEPAHLLVIVGPTASGKTEFAVRIAERCGGEIVSADSVQVYRHFDLGSGKPSADERRRAPHHLVDVVDPLEPMDAARWSALAANAIADVRARGRLPIVCGGTFLWVRALLFGLAGAPPADPAVRARLEARGIELGRAALHRELALVDPTSAARLSPNDVLRVSRALEVYELTGIPLSQWHARHGFREAIYPARLVGIAHPRDELDRRIERRVRAMFDAGWIEETERLIREGYGAARAMRSVGYRQIVAALARGAQPEREALVGEVYRATRVFVRRQRTWLRDQPVTWLAPRDADAIRLPDGVLEDVREPDAGRSPPREP